MPGCSGSCGRTRSRSSPGGCSRGTRCGTRPSTPGPVAVCAVDRRAPAPLAAQPRRRGLRRAADLVGRRRAPHERRHRGPLPLLRDGQRPRPLRGVVPVPAGLRLRPRPPRAHGRARAGLGLQPPRRHRAPVALGGASTRSSSARWGSSTSCTGGSNEDARADAMHSQRALPPRLRRRAHRHGPHRPRRRRPARQRRALRARRRRPGRPAAGRPRRRRRPRRPPVPRRRRRDRAALPPTLGAWGLWHHSLLTGRDGRPEAWISHCIDVSKRKHAEEELSWQATTTRSPACPTASSSSSASAARSGPSAPASPCCSSTSTTSRSSTTRSATAPAIACSAASPSGCAASCAPTTSSPASAATSSPSCCPASPARRYALAGGRPPGRGAARAARARRRAPLRHRQRRRELQRARRGRSRTRCCATPTRRCTAPRSWASRAARSSTTRCASARWSAWSSRAACATRSTTASCASSTSRSSTLDDGRVTGVEALLRWDHPVFGVVAPLRFIPLAERNGLIVPIGAWVLREACRQLAAWGDDALSVSVNVSARQLGSTDLVDVVARGPRGLRHRAGPAVPGDHRDGDDGRPRRHRRDARRRSRRSACAWRSTTSAWATPRCASCAPCCRSTR